MAIRTLTKNRSPIVYSSKMQAGEKVEGYFVAFSKGQTKNPSWPAPTVIQLQSESGQMTEVYTTGSLKYVETNAQQDPTQALIPGQFTIITKTGSYKNKQGKDFATFTVQQDDSRTFPPQTQTAAVDASTPAPSSTTSMEERLNRARRQGV